MIILDIGFQASRGVGTSCQVKSCTARFGRWKVLGCRAGAAQSSLLRINPWNKIFKVEQHYLQDVSAVAWIIWRLDVNEAVNFFMCALNVKLLSRKMPRRQEHCWPKLIGWLPMERTGHQMLLFVQVGKTSLLSVNLKAFKSCTWAWEECQHLTYGIEAFLSEWYRRFPWSPTLSTVGSHLLLLRRYGWSDLHSFNIYETLAM